jgi:hypothetical protein
VKRLRFVLLFGLAAMLGATIGVVAAGGNGDLSPTFAAILAVALGKLIVMVAAIGAMSSLLYSTLSELPRPGWPHFLAGTVYGLGSTIGALESQASSQLLVPSLAAAAFVVIALLQSAISRKAGAKGGAA